MNNIKGFTLVEILIVVAIIGILSAIAYPSYQSSVMKSHRSEGMELLFQVMEAQENFYSDNLTYSTDLDGQLGYSADPVVSTSEYYQVSAAACGGGIGRCVVLTATAINGQIPDGNLTLNSRGERTPADSW